jgi:pimeloyl-ACP methyl ester carboxylesterase
MRICFLLGRVKVAADSLPVGRELTFESHLGPITLHMFPPIDTTKGKHHVPVIFIHGIKEELAFEWKSIAEEAASNGFHACIINFHSNPKTKPSLVREAIGASLGVSSSDISRIIRDVVVDLYNSKMVILFGKSWGGMQALKFANTYPTIIKKIGFIAPASSDATLIENLHSFHFPVFLGWARDDPVVAFRNTDSWSGILGRALRLTTVETGGHLVLPAYNGPVIDFLNES